MDDLKQVSGYAITRHLDLSNSIGEANFMPNIREVKKDNNIFLKTLNAVNHFSNQIQNSYKDLEVLQA